MVGRNKEVFQTAATTAWPAALCEVPARNLVAELLNAASASKAQERRERERAEAERGGGSKTTTTTRIAARVRKPWRQEEDTKRGAGKGEVRGSAWWWPGQGSIRADVEELRGKILLCHCDRDQACHADVLLNALRDTQGFLCDSIREEAPLVEFIDDGLPNKLVFKEDVKEAAGDESREGWRSVGVPRRTHYMGRDKPHADGGGLRSPGRWPKASRRLPGGFAMELLDQARRVCEPAELEARTVRSQ